MLRYVKAGVLPSLAFLVLGVLLLVMPQTSLLWICYAFGAVVLVTGIVCLIQYARVRGSGFAAPFLLVGGVITAALGLFTLAQPQTVAASAPPSIWPDAKRTNGGSCCCSACFPSRWACCCCSTPLKPPSAP